MSNFTKGIKIFLISALAILVVGMSLLGFLGFNQTVDYKDSYELHLSVDQVDSKEKAVSILAETAEAAIKEHDIRVVSEQKLNGGATIILKVKKEVSKEVIADIQKDIQAKLNTETKGILAKVELFSLNGSYGKQVLNVALGLGIGLIVCWLFVLILNKIAASVAVLASSVLSILLHIALVALTRIPAQPYFSVSVAIATIFGLVVSTIITTKYRSEVKKDNKSTNKDIIDRTNASLKVLYAFFALAVLLCSIVFSIMTSMIVGLIMFVAGVVGIFTAIFFTPFIWSLIRKK